MGAPAEEADGGHSATVSHHLRAPRADCISTVPTLRDMDSRNSDFSIFIISRSKKQQEKTTINEQHKKVILKILKYTGKIHVSTLQISTNLT